MPDVAIGYSALIEKDIEEVEQVVPLDSPGEYMCVSFAQKGQDLPVVIASMDRMYMPKRKRPEIFPKTEKPQALTNIEGVIAKSQAVMVARGDLGVALKVERMPFVQNLLVKKARETGLCVIMAMQRDESMLENPVPAEGKLGPKAAANGKGIKEHANRVFQGVTEEGLRAEEKMHNIRPNILEGIMHRDAIHRKAGQILPSTRRCGGMAESTAQRTEQEPLFLVETTYPQDAVAHVLY